MPRCATEKGMKLANLKSEKEKDHGASHLDIKYDYNLLILTF